MNTYAIPALKRKRAELAGNIALLRRQITRHQKELASVDATIGLFDPAYRIGSIKAIDPRRRKKLFKMGELGRHIMDALRRAQGTPLATRDITSAVAAAIGEPDVGRAVVHASVRANLGYLHRRGKVVKGGDRKTAMWRLS